MNILIIEDEKRTAQRLEGLLMQYDPTIRVMAQLPSIAKTLAWFADPANEKPDLLLLDIHLDDGSGFQLIEQAQLSLPIIFTTAYDQYTLQAFKTNSVDYLLKPIDADELGAALDKFKRLYGSAVLTPLPDMTALLQALKMAPSPYRDRFMVTIGTKIRSIETPDIAYFYFEDKSTWLTTRDGQHVSIEYSLDKLTTLLNPQRFFRVNRAFLVALDAIQTIHTYSGSKLKVELKPVPRQEIFVSGDRIADFKEWLGK
ncbi:LytR/AlgR family response regulator transcription factor [Spirosoma pollinicola]|uniref:DNA-binding response regulator n=1 Tax=Spirosoma pollinicola TaxID=2057025 RepID=A0A2K8Z7L3_9BACT|nr:LytTR family DNA-binding domain-containing protein [Spirosoma pollinicola]AUD05809.1 DNA-binding response regulator [Spirosoma pollinicola]